MRGAQSVNKPMSDTVSPALLLPPHPLLGRT